MQGDLLDLILIALAAAFAVAGYRQGFIVGVLSFVGFLGGAAVGALVSPGIAQDLVTGSAQQALVAIVLVFAAAMVGQVLTSVLGASMRSHLTWRPASFVDAVGGAAVSVVSVLLIAWLIGSAAANAPFPGVAGQVNQSAVLRGVDRVMPTAARTMFSNFRRLLASGPYTQVFGALGAEGTLTVPRPDPAVVNSAGVRRDSASVVKVVGVAPECGKQGLQLEGSGFVIGPGRVLTNAHVVAGVREGLAVYDVSGKKVPSQVRVVLYDPERDIAVLDVPGLHAPLLTFLPDAKRGSSAIVVGYPENGPFTAVPARIGSEQRASGLDIYQANTVTRQIYAVRAEVRPGNSGGPLISPGGGVYGVVFAAAMNAPHTGYALTAREIAPDVHKGMTATRSVSTQGCTLG